VTTATNRGSESGIQALSSSPTSSILQFLFQLPIGLLHQPHSQFAILLDGHV